MNPPPIPPSATQRTTFPQQAATASLIAPVLVVILSIATTSLLQGQNSATTRIILDIAAGALISLGVLLAVLALVGIPQYGPKGILGKGVAGLVINGILTFIFATNIFLGYQKKLQARTAALQKVKSAEADIRAGNRNSFDPNTGITNIDVGKLDRLNSALKNASTNLTGDDASISQAMAAHIARLHGALTNYQAAVTELRDAEVLNNFNTTNKAQFAARREVVEHFLQANATLTEVITNCENRINADLQQSHVSAAHIKITMDNFHASAAPLNAINVRIRACDDRVGAAMLDALNLLEAKWYKWSVSATTGRIRFEDPADLAAYNKSMQAMQDAGQQQLNFQKQLVRLQQTMNPQ